MTDYLEELLEQHISDVESGTLDWHKGNLRVWGRQAGEQLVDGGATHPQEQTADHAVMYSQEMPGQGDMYDIKNLVQAAAEDVWHKRIGQMSLVGQMARLHRTVLQVRERGGSGNAAAQSVTQPGMADVRYGGSMSVRRVADYATAVDAAFQRDARRYDGPLGLL